MNLLLQTQTGEVVLEDDDPQLSYMITSWVRICKLLGPKFEPYLPMVMPQVLKTASLTVEMALLDRKYFLKKRTSGDQIYLKPFLQRTMLKLTKTTVIGNASV